MPGNVAAATPATVLPEFVSGSFELVVGFEDDFNYYCDGSAQAAALTSLPRRVWRADVPCDSPLLSALREFWLARRMVEAFYFYYWRETVPLGAVDPTGNSTVGRYVVKFNSAWREEFTLGRTPVQIELIEAL